LAENPVMGSYSTGYRPLEWKRMGVWYGANIVIIPILIYTYIIAGIVLQGNQKNASLVDIAYWIAFWTVLIIVPTILIILAVTFTTPIWFTPAPAGVWSGNLSSAIDEGNNSKLAGGPNVQAVRFKKGNDTRLVLKLPSGNKAILCCEDTGKHRIIVEMGRRVPPDERRELFAFIGDAIIRTAHELDKKDRKKI